MKHRRIPLLLLALLFASFPAALRAQEAAAPPAKQQLNEQLWEAARKGDAAAVKTLLDRGADVNARFRYNQTPLFKAAERGHVEVIKVLLERGADVNVKDSFYGATPLTWAVDKGHTEVVRALLAKGAQGADGVLMSGVRKGDKTLVAIALERGGLPPATLTAALAAAATSEGGPGVVEMLKRAGAQPPFEVDAATLQTYVGSYKSEQGSVVTFSLKDGKPFVTPTGQPPSALMALDKTTFRPTAFDGVTITFVVESGKVTAFNFKQGAETRLFKRVEQ